jgi:hypothetical protein
MGSLTQKYRVTAHRWADLHQSVQVHSLIRAEERAIVRAIGAQEARRSFASGIPGNHYWVVAKTAPGINANVWHQGGKPEFVPSSLTVM